MVNNVLIQMIFHRLCILIINTIDGYDGVQILKVVLNLNYCISIKSVRNVGIIPYYYEIHTFMVIWLQCQ